MYDSYYDKPEWWFRFRYDTQVKRKTCLYLLKQTGHFLRDQRVLEIGFGSGAVLFSFHPSCEIRGIELSHSAIAHAEIKAKKLGYKSAEFRYVDGNILPYTDDYFDVVIASHVVEHVEDDLALLQEIRRTIKSDGVAVILIPINEKYDDPNHMHHYTTVDFIALAEMSQLTPILILENELLFHFVEKFYYEKFNYRWKMIGPIIALLFNFPTSVFPFWLYRFVEKIMLAVGWKPRQLACILAKA